VHAPVLLTPWLFKFTTAAHCQSATQRQKAGGCRPRHRPIGGDRLSRSLNRLMTWAALDREPASTTAIRRHGGAIELPGEFHFSILTVILNRG
jgi:hypothetical protein